jgi:hypothetical protein
MWNDDKGPVYFTVLHFCFGIGNLLGPLLAEVVLEEKKLVDTNNLIPYQVGQTNIEQDTWIALIQPLQLSNLQILHGVIAAFLLMVGFMFVITVFLTEDASLTGRSRSSSSLSSPKLLDHGPSLLKIAFIISMTLLFCIANGINFAYSNFVTIFAVTSRLSLTKSDGARTTAIFFACSALMKFSSIALLKLLKPIQLLIFNMVILMISSILLITKGEDDLIAFQVGTALAGIGISTLFSTGVVWAQTQVSIGSKITAIFLIATSIGAQCFKIPVTSMIETYPMSLMVTLFLSTMGILVTMMTAKIICLVGKYFRDHPLSNDFIITAVSSKSLGDLAQDDDEKTTLHKFHAYS